MTTAVVPPSRHTIHCTMTSQMSPDQLFAVFHEQVRLGGKDMDVDQVADRDGPVRRWYGQDPTSLGAMIESPEGLGTGPEARIARQRDFFAGRGQRVEWKTYGYDQPPDLRQRLTRAGFVEQEVEALVLGEVSALAGPVPLEEGLRARDVEAARDFDRIADLMATICGEDTRWVSDRLAAEHVDRPDRLAVSIVEQDEYGPVLCAGWVRFAPGTRFASMWGGSTAPAWRRKGFYRAALAHRATVAAERGYDLVRIDASPASRPILQALGLHQVTTTTPFTFDPGA